MESKVMLVRGHCIVSLGSNRDESRRSYHARCPLLSWHSLGCSCRLASSPAAHSFTPLKCSHRLRSYCFSESQQSSSSTSIEDLRRQLEVLHLEAEQARGRANAARARFMRLTETVENLRTRAITDLTSGKEESARQSIVEKQKVMHALEKSKQRAELLEELCSKLSEAISHKELQIMASLTSTTVEIRACDAATENIRIVSPKGDDLASDQIVNIEQMTDSLGEEVTGTSNLANNEYAESIRPDLRANDDAMNKEYHSICDTSTMPPTEAETYPDFLWSIDNHLHEADVQLHKFLKIAAIVVPEDVDKNTKERVAVVKEIWQDVLVARTRIKKALQQ